MSDSCQPKKEQNDQKPQEDEATSNIEEAPEIQLNVECGKSTQEIKEKGVTISEIQSIETEDSSVKINIEDDIITQALENRAVKMSDKRVGSNSKKWYFKRRRKSDHHPPEGQQYRSPPIMVYFETSQPIGPPLQYTPDRNAFVRLVFSICAVMLAFTVAFVAVCVLTDIFKGFMRSIAGLIVLVIMWILDLAVMYIYMYSNCGRKFPCNIILNIIVTIANSYICGFIAIGYAPWIVLFAFLVTLSITLFCIGLACTSFDFTRCILLVVVASLAATLAFVIVFILRMVTDLKLTLAHMIILIVSAVITSVMMVIELQMILGGRSLELGEEEYTYGAFMVYNSIITLFLLILRIMGLSMGGSHYDDDYD